MFYAHSGKDGDFATWELLAKHLQEVADRAGGLASRFDQPIVGRVLGLLHDAGKATDAYQLYIQKKGPSPDHSTAGAVIARERYGKHWGTLLAACIAGHHAGLADGEGSGLKDGLTSLEDRLARVKNVPALPDGVALPDPALVRTSMKHLNGFRRSLLGRMLFSALIDADRLATEAFYTDLNGQTVERGCDIGLPLLRDRLTAHLDAVAAKARADVEADPSLGPVNDLRARVLTHVLAQADREPGLFSLTVPTGGGKTLASLAFALNHAVHWGKRRVIYVIPFTSIVEQTADVFRRALGEDDAILEHHSGFDAAAPSAKTATGTNDAEGPDGAAKARLAAENWDRPVVVTTAVQFFESLFSNRPGKCRKLHNIAGSVIILDEAQTLPQPLLRPDTASSYISRQRRRYSIAKEHQ
ncbi:CRISPR-associated endonuclease Cas3'' [Oleisolibacter albus]|uniref:CRISPR-associated endonuclease Cas3'' n=1 Tax=Oleisolibacter albus TaxID=2171757 RepID=UPI000DF275C6|nr:CRISPR-associated endonuclease Cas3'' [Oleisolibacter albus]